MADTACLALRLLAALREEKARAVEELLRLGADPNLVLDDGAAAVHLAARASHPRALHCLRMLLRWGADPNARSAEGLTPVHVAAAWGCCGALELLLSRGGDPTLRDQDGLRPLDWALQQRHHNCARVLQELDTLTQPDETREPTETFHVAQGSFETETCQGPALAGSSGVSQDSELHVHRAELEVEAVEVAVHPQSSEATENSDYSSDASFVTAVEDSLQPGRPGGALELVAGLWVTGGAVSAGKGAPNCQPQVLTLTARDTDKPVLPGDGDLGALHPHSSVPPMSDLQLLQALRGLGYSPGPVTPFTRGHYLRRLQEAQASRADVGHSQELAEALRTGTIPDCQVDEEALAQCFQRLDPLKKWREGITKSSFTYLLLDPRNGVWGRAVVAYAFNPSTWEAEAGGFLSSRPAWCLGSVLAVSTHFMVSWKWVQWPFSLSAIITPPFHTVCSVHVTVCMCSHTVVLMWRSEDSSWKSVLFCHVGPTWATLYPRLTKDLPARASSLTLAECLQCFVRAIFYVGKGTRARPDAHLWEALGYHDQPRKQVCPKVRRILDIWASGRGIISLHCFQHVVAMEAYTREACLLDALGLQTLTNQKQGHYYGVVAHWPPPRRRRLGVHLLQRALLVFLAEGERELRPQDIQARG